MQHHHPHQLCNENLVLTPIRNSTFYINLRQIISIAPIFKIRNIKRDLLIKPANLLQL